MKVTGTRVQMLQGITSAFSRPSALSSFWWAVGIVRGRVIVARKRNLEVDHRAVRDVPLLVEQSTPRDSNYQTSFGRGDIGLRKVTAMKYLRSFPADAVPFAVYTHTIAKIANAAPSRCQSMGVQGDLTVPSLCTRSVKGVKVDFDLELVRTEN